ncbi:MAG TPA: c-type cytochrome biogenesis protein CcmI, partial [Tabrizicola sp.]|nr:c-type cytochrome biogenesis protein CcmI [Tabrizicola sp.]
MAGWEFWVLALCLATAAALVLIRAMLKAAPVGAGASTDLAVYKDQLADIDRDLARGTINPDEAGRLRAEVGRRVLAADREQAESDSPAKAPGNPIQIAAIVVLLAVPLALLAYGGSASILRGFGFQEDRILALKDQLSFGLGIRSSAFPRLSLVFEGLGAPGYPDMALEPRLQALDQAMAARPGQDAELARLGTARDTALDARLATELAAMTDPTAMRNLFRQRLEAGEMQAAVRTQERLIALLGANTNAADHANLALALVVEAKGYVSPEAETQLRETLTRDMSNELARYLVGEMFLQGGRYDQAFRFWRPIGESGDPSTPWVGSIRERIEEVAGLAGVRYALPEATQPAPDPSAAELAAAAEMAPEDRQAMIEGMVAQLSNRLATEGGSVEDWTRLI